ncbi:MAG: ribosome maturation factor RimP [Marmoricola sp.]|nr:ribosome maturation factor RimP [Marmoricola sp.]
MSTSDTRDRLAEQLSAPVGALGLDLEAVDLSSAGKRRVLKVAVDKDGGVTMDDIAEATRAVSRTLDDQDLMGERAYTLEVSSPGVDRPLTLPRHWRRNAGRLVKVTPHEGDPVTGRITASDDDGVVLDVDGAERRLAFADVRRAKVQVEFRPAPSPSEEA